ncbi:MAG: SRPBCC family protein [Solirubrobacteraceae bacterium]
MATARRTRRLSCSQQELWEVISDPHHMPRWWPGVERVEGVEGDRFTQVFKTKRGRSVRADFHVTESEAPRVHIWEQDIPGTPFERVLTRSVIEVALDPVDGGTDVTIAHLQKLRGYSRTGGFLLKGATRSKLDEALDGLQRICG